MSSSGTEGRESISFKALLDENRVLKNEVRNLRERLEEAEELSRAISEGDLDALVIPRPEGELIFTLDSADQAYRVLVETMNEGTSTLAFDGTILYCNRRFAELLRMPLQAVIGTSIYQFIAPESTVTFNTLLKQEKDMGEVKLQAEGGVPVPVYLSVSSFQIEGSPNAWCLVITDLTEQKKNEEILAAEHLARSIIEQAAEIIVVCDTSGKIIRFSNSMLKLCGYHPIFQHFEDLIDLRSSEEGDAGEKILPVSSALKGSTILGRGATFERKGFQKLHLLLNSGPLKNDSGEIIGAVVTLADITERKRAEEALRESEARLATVLQNLPVGIWVVNSMGKVTAKNEAADLIWRGNAPISSCPKNYVEYIAWDVETGQRLETDDYPLTRTLRTGLPVTPVELRIRRFDGTDGIIMMSTTPLKGPGGELTGAVGINIDITERKKVEKALQKAHEILEKKVKERTAELEEAYNSLLENEMRLSEAQKIAHLGSWDWNPLTNELFWSDEMYRIFRLDPLEFGATYDAFLSYIDPKDRDYVNNAMMEALNGEPLGIDYRIISSGGEKRIVHSQGEAVFNEKGTPVRMRGILQDITERKKTEETLERMDKIRIKEIHHRIKNNLQVISSLLDLQAEKFEEEKVKEAFREGQNRVVSMSLIHEELYNGEGTDTLDFSAYLKKLAENLFQTYNLRSKYIHMSMDLEENMFLDMDTSIPLGIIVNELISNSLKHAFTEKQEGEIRIKLCKEEQNNETRQSLFSLTVSDNGKGIPENIELENTESLGLQLVGILVDQLDGETELKREQGTEFRITFNVAETNLLSD